MVNLSAIADGKILFCCFCTSWVGRSPLTSLGGVRTEYCFVNCAFLLQENPFLFTSSNSKVQGSGIDAENNGGKVPYWAAIVAATAGILAGALIAWVITTHRASKRPYSGNTATGEKVTTF